MRKLLLFVLLLAFLPACTRSIYVPVESERTEMRSDSTDVSHSSLKVDSVVFRDTVTIMARGDTIFHEVIKWRERLRIRNDTVFRDRNKFIIIKDSIKRPVPYPVEKKVYIDKPLSAWQKFRMHSFWFLTVSLAASLLYIFRKPLLRLMCRLRL